MNYTKGKWNIRGNRIFIDDSYRSVATVEVQKNYEDVTFKPIEDVERIANTKLIASAPLLYETMKDILNVLGEKELVVNSDEYKLWEKCNNVIKSIEQTY